jgi:hypothetical protein
MTSHIYQPFGVRSSPHLQCIAVQILVYFWQIVHEAILLLLAAVRTHRQKKLPYLLLDVTYIGRLNPSFNDVK